MLVPEHDALIRAVQETVREATDPLSVDETHAALLYAPVSYGTIRKIRDWCPGKGSFRLDVLLKAHDWAIENLPKSEV